MGGWKWRWMSSLPSQSANRRKTGQKKPEKGASGNSIHAVDERFSPAEYLSGWIGLRIPSMTGALITRDKMATFDDMMSGLIQWCIPRFEIDSTIPRITFPLRAL
jgi:hypothetical protein